MGETVMKPSRTTKLGVLLAALVAACLLGSAVPAWAALGDTWSGTSESNPNTGTAAWRQGWGNSLTPEVTISSYPSDPDTATMGFLYTFTRTGPSDVPTDSSSVTWDPSGLMLSHTFDLYDLYRDIPGNASAQPKDLEGWWWMNPRFFAQSRISTDTNPSFSFGIDVTPPNPVEGFSTGVVVPTPAPRRTIRWWNKQYDALSGVWFYHLYLNGQEFRTVSLDQIPTWMGYFPYMTLEDLPPGVNTIGITAEDRATNVSAMKTVTAIVDPDYPGVYVSSPAQGAWVQ